jgi:hypothetical protein
MFAITGNAFHHSYHTDSLNSFFECVRAGSQERKEVSVLELVLGNEVRSFQRVRERERERERERARVRERDREEQRDREKERQRERERERERATERERERERERDDIICMVMRNRAEG